MNLKCACMLKKNRKTNSGVCFATAYWRTIFPSTTNKVKISGPNRSVEITDQYFSCISVNVIYGTISKLYNKIYVGETNSRLAGRFREHIRDVMMQKKNDSGASKAVTCHFNPHSHSHLNMTICTVYTTKKPQKSLRKISSFNQVYTLSIRNQ